MKFRLLSHDSINKQFQVVVWYGVKGVLKVRWLRVHDFRVIRSSPRFNALSHGSRMAEELK